ncbi:MAG: ribonuclease HII [Holosporaceae bacterium]|jgi:ribonuclease HII|nr:ribonuclease HII [Holosporaceae bacterium]
MKSDWLKENGLSLNDSVGIDEVGRGPLAGPVVAAAVWISREAVVELKNSGLVVQDSKKMTSNQRKKIVEWLTSQEARCSIASATVEEIDGINILNATFRAMERAYDSLAKSLGFSPAALIDGDKAPPNIKSAQAIVKGDDKILSISLASIIAKEYRDDLMRELARKFPDYGWETNVGYGTAKHIATIRKIGLTPYHRKSFCKRIFER